MLVVAAQPWVARVEQLTVLVVLVAVATQAQVAQLTRVAAVDQPRLEAQAL
jgi:hypothetical protein